jgi:hypothetical protein
MDIRETPLSVPKIPESTVYIFNMSEDVWPFISAMSDAKAKLFEIKENADLADRELFTCADEDHILFVLPEPVDENFLEYYTDLFGKKNIRIVVPQKHTGVICEDILDDDDVMGSITEAANGSKRLSVTSYTTSQQFLQLVEELRNRGFTVITPDAPEEEDSWTVNFYGSKSGIRQLAGESRAAEPDFVMSEGIIVTGIEDAAKIAAKKYIKEHGVVIKTNKGHSGVGVLLFDEGDLPMEYAVCEQAILEVLKKDAYWTIFPIIIESYISVNPVVGGGYPNVEYRIQKNGHVEFLYYCGMRMTSAGEFKGVEIHNDVVSDAVAARMVDTGFFIGEKYRAAGYRGYYDVDFVAAKNGQLYVTESNVRRTGGTYVWATAERLFGKDFMYSTYILSYNLYELPKNKSYTFEEIRASLIPILFNKQTKEGIIIAAANLLSQHRMAYIIFGASKKRAYEIEAEMEELLAAA